MLLVGLLKEGNKELARLEHLRTQDSIQESLVVCLALHKLSRCLFLELLSRKGRNDNLWVGAEQEVTQDGEVAIQALDTPLHRECIDGNHHALILG